MTIFHPSPPVKLRVLHCESVLSAVMQQLGVQRSEVHHLGNGRSPEIGSQTETQMHAETFTIPTHVHITINSGNRQMVSTCVVEPSQPTPD